MKTQTKVILMITILFSLVTCVYAQNNSPTSVVRSYLSHAQSGDISSMFKLCTEEFEKRAFDEILSSSSSYGERLLLGKYTKSGITVNSGKIYNNYAIVFIKFQRNGNEIDSYIPLKKVGANWKINGHCSGRT